MVTIEFNQSCTGATITIPQKEEFYTISIIDTSTNNNVDFTSEYVSDTSVIKVKFSKQTILEITVFNEDEVIDVFPILINCSSLKCLMSSNKKDVVKQLKSCNIDNDTALLEATNRVVIANTKLKNYELGIQGLNYLESLCENNNCESC
jgi:hypothetical protein